MDIYECYNQAGRIVAEVRAMSREEALREARNQGHDVARVEIRWVAMGNSFISLEAYLSS